MRCPKCGKEFNEGKFCPNCGTPCESQEKLAKNQSTKKKWYQGTAITILTLIIFFPIGLIHMWKYRKNWKLPVKIIITAFMALGLIGTFVEDTPDQPNEKKVSENKSNTNTVKKKTTEKKTTEKKTVSKKTTNPKKKIALSKRVTGDRLQGTYVTKGGKYFAIDIENEKIFKVSKIVAEINPNKTQSDCKAIFPDSQWEEQECVIDATGETITTGVKNYKYVLDKKELTLIDKEGKKTDLKKISDEYNASKILDSKALNSENVSKDYYRSDQELIHIERVNNELVDICVAYNNVEQNKKTIIALVKNVPFKELSNQYYICLVGKNYNDTNAVALAGPDSMVSVKHGSAYIKRNKTSNLKKQIEEYVKQHKNVNYDYNAISKDIKVIFTKDDIAVMAFNTRWYKQYKHFMQEGTNTIEVKYIKDGKIKIIRNGKPYCTFKETNYVYEGTNIIYSCDNGKKFEYFPNGLGTDPYEKASIRFSGDSVEYRCSDDK